MPNITILRHAIPGIGEALELPTASGTALIVVVHRSGRRDVFVRPAGSDNPAAAVALSEQEAIAFVGLLVGASIHIVHPSTTADDTPPTNETNQERRPA